jgi:hypothetical protein
MYAHIAFMIVAWVFLLPPGRCLPLQNTHSSGPVALTQVLL